MSEERQEIVVAGPPAGMVKFEPGSNPFSDFGDEAGGYSVYVKFDGNEGGWSQGKNKEVIEDGEQVVMNMYSVTNGWICWKDSAVVEEINIPIMTGKKPPLEQDLKEHGPYEDKDDGWSAQATVTMAFLQDGGNLEYKTTSESGRRALMNLSKEFGDKMGMHLDDEGGYMMPIVELGNQPFDYVDKKTKKKKGVKYAPVFKIIDWITFAEMTVLLKQQEEATEGDTVQRAMADAAEKSGRKVKALPASDPKEPKKEKKKKKGKKKKGKKKDSESSDETSDRRSRY